MSKKITKKRAFIRNLFKGITFTSMAFVFQACYGMPQDFGSDVFIHGIVKSSKTNKPIEGIKIYVNDEEQLSADQTNVEGSFAFYAPEGTSYRLSFQDANSEQNGLYTTKDTIIYHQSINQSLVINLDPVE